MESGNFKFENQADWNQFAHHVASQGIVLLKNDNDVLPVGKEKIAVFGCAQIIAQKASEGVRVSEKSKGITMALKDAGVNIDDELYEVYSNWQSKSVGRRYGDWGMSHSSPEMEVSEELVLDAKSRGAQKAFIVLARSSFENSDMNIEKGDYLLSDIELDMITNVCSVFDQVVLLLHIGSSIDFGFLDDCNISGILYLNQLGVIGAKGLADIVTGKVCPSARLTDTIAKHYEDYPSSANFGQHGGGLLQDYREDIYVGYRYFDSFDGKDEKVLFPFGYGLSYTEFSMSDITFEKTDKINVSVLVTNIGKTAGKQVIQLYYAAPTAKDGAILCAPAKQLCGFEKTGLLKPGMSQRLNFTLDIDDMASYDDLGVLGEKSCFVIEKGRYQILIGTHSRDLTLAGEHIETENRVIKRCHSIPTTLPERLNGYGNYEKLPEPKYGKDRYYGVSTMGETVLTAKNSCDRDIDAFSALKAGESISYRLMPGAGGGYHIRVCRDDSNVNISDFFKVEIDGIEIGDLKLKEDGSGEINLPLARTLMTLTAKTDNTDIDRIIFEKIDAKTEITADGVNFIDAGNMYEGSFTINLVNFSDDGFGNSGTCITKLTRRGMFALYKLEVIDPGVYDIQFKYAYCGESRPLNESLALFASNIIQPLGGAMLEKTYEEGQNRVFKTTEKCGIMLPKGTVYLKVAVENVPAPDIAGMILTKSESSELHNTANEEKIEEKNKKSGGIRRKQLEDFSDVAKIGIQFEDVYRNPDLMPDFLQQLSNRELATIVSGTILNRTPGGDVGCNHPLPERGVPAAQTADGPWGFRQQDQLPTAYPVGKVLAASFDKELFTQYGECLANEAKYYGIDIVLGPQINIHRNPAIGRSYFSEDPYLSGIASAYYIKGLQGNGVAACLKHYAANNCEFERLKSNSRVSERALREIYLKGFEIAIKLSNPLSIMSSYNHINDIKVDENYTLITEIPRDEWHWEGAFFTDWWNDSVHVNELKAGHDLRMPTGDIDLVTEALDNGTLTREQVSVCAERVINMLMRIGRIQDEMEQ